METVEQRAQRVERLEAGRRGVSEQRALTVQNAQPLLTTPHAGQAITTQNALGIGTVYAAVRALVDAAASIPLHMFRRLPDGGRERVTDDRARWLKLPAPGVAQYQLLADVMGSLQLHGDAFVAKANVDGEVQQVFILDPQRVQVKLSGGVRLFEITSGGELKTYSSADVVHVRSPLSMDTVRGLSPIQAVKSALGVASALEEYQAASLENGGRVSGVLTVDAGPDQADVMTNLRDGFSGRHSGAKNAGKFAVLGSEVKLTQLSISPHDLDFIAQNLSSAQAVARCFRLPAWVLSLPSGDSLTYATVEGQQLAFLTWSLRPWLVAIEQTFSADEDLCPGDLYVEHELDAVLRSDAKTQAEVLTAALNPQTGWMRRDEARRVLNLPPEREEAPTDA